MSVLLLKAAVIVCMFFGSAGGAVAVASNSLPDSPLYPAKLSMEQARLNASSDLADQAALHMTLAQSRVQEMVRLAGAGKVPGEATLLRLQKHLQRALHLAGGLDDDDLPAALTRARQMLQNQEQELAQAQTGVGDPARERLAQALRLLQWARQHVENGLQDPQTLRWQYTYGPTTDCPSGDCEPAGDQHQHGQEGDQPGPQGPGPNPDCPSGDCEPAGDQNQHGQEGDQPGPQGPGPNPDCPSGDCEPAGDQNQHGQEGDQPGPQGPGPNPDCPSGDCEPDGDQNQHGQEGNQNGGDSGAESAPSGPPTSGEQRRGGS